MQHEQQLLLAQQAQSDACLRTEQRIPLLASGRDGGGSCYRTAAAHVGEIMAAARMAAYGRGALAYLPTGDSYDPVCANSELNHEQFDTAPDLATTALYTIARMLPEPATGVSVTPSATTTNQPNSRAISGRSRVRRRWRADSEARKSMEGRTPRAAGTTALRRGRPR